MKPDIVLVVTIGVLYSCGVYLLLERSLTRVLLGILILGNATNLLLLSSGGEGKDPPFVGLYEPEQMSDPLAHAMILTAIVITLGMAAFLLAMIYRSWHLARQDDVIDDIEDRRIALREGTEQAEAEGEDEGEVR